MPNPLPAELPIPTRPSIDAHVRIPGSKSLSNRALLLAALADGESSLFGLLDSDDTRVMARALGQIGASFAGEFTRDLKVRGIAGRPQVPSGPIDVHASGTAARFLTGALALVPGESVLDGSARMRQRPIRDLVDALRALGVSIAIEGQNGCPPLRCHGGQPFGGEVEVDASRSSQYVSALLQIAPYAARDVTVQLRDGVLTSRPYVDVTLAVMTKFGAEAKFSASGRSLEVSSRARYRGIPYTVEPDASTAAYFFVAAAISAGRVVVEGLPGDSAQADMGLLGVLERMGATVTRSASSVELQGPSAGLSGVDVDMNSMPDAVLALAVGAAFANSPSQIRNVANLRIKETDRLQALETELRKLGAGAEAGTDTLRVTPRPLHGASIDTYDDHRMAMAFALAGLRVPGVVIREPGCVSKSWPGYFDTFLQL